MTQTESVPPYSGLYGEVVTEDCYRLNKLPFTPDIFFDIGANIGICTRFALRLWPNVRVIAVEPDRNNALEFRLSTEMERVVLYQHALGPGPFFYNPGAINGAHKAYLCDGLGHTAGTLARNGLFEKIQTPGIMLSDLFAMEWAPSWAKVVLKVDCEGGENTIWDHRDSVAALARADYIAMELHNSAPCPASLARVNEQRQSVLDQLKETHQTAQDTLYFWALKKGLHGNSV